MNNFRIRIATMSDSAKIHSGFATVIERLNMGFHNYGMEVHHLGFMDPEHDFEHTLPYYFYPTTPFDELGHSTYSLFLRKVKPDIVFILTDPGNLVHYANGVVHNNAATYLRNGREYTPPIVAYTPIEGMPLAFNYKEGFEAVRQTAGEIVFYNETARQNVRKMGWDEIADTTHVVNHGLNHCNFRRYSANERRILRELTGLDKFFLVGAGGANKRTKGFDSLIYTARCLREIGQDKGIKFYCHTNPDRPTMMGYSLLELASYDWDNKHPDGVTNMFLWKQVRGGNYWQGIPRENGSIKDIEKLDGKIPKSAKQRGFLFANLDFVSMLNTFDLYLDLSQNEGWGLVPGEAMACGVPTAMVNDNDVRREIYDGGVYWIDPIEPRLWSTLHTGARVVQVDPLEAAKAIIHLRDNPGLREELSECGQKVAARYKWEDAQEQMCQIVQMVADFVFEEDLAFLQEAK